MTMMNTRRTLLKVAAVLGGSSIAGASISAAQDDGDGGEPDFQLGGEQSGWQGVAPDAIADETNPTLELTAGEEYVLEWENLDGIGHNFVIEDADGEDLVSTEIITNGTQTVEFTASEEMAEYYCQPHPTSMRGDIELVEGDSDGGGNGQEFAAAVDELFELMLDDEGWHRDEPGEDQIGTEDEEQTVDGNQTENGAADGNQTEDRTSGEDDTTETNPALELEQGGVYVINWTNQLEAEAVTDGEDDGDGESANEGGDDQNASDDGDGDESDVAGADPQQRPIELVVLNGNDEEIVRSDPTAAEGSSAVVFTATTDIATYRDAETGAEGEFDVVEGDGDSQSEDGDDGDSESGSDE